MTYFNNNCCERCSDGFGACLKYDRCECHHSPVQESGKVSDEQWEKLEKMPPPHLLSSASHDDWYKEWDIEELRYAIDKEVDADFWIERINSLLKKETEAAEKRGEENMRHAGLFSQGKAFENARVVAVVKKLKKETLKYPLIKQRGMMGTIEAQEFNEGYDAALSEVLSAIKVDGV